MLNNPIVALFLILSMLMIFIACLKLQFRQAGESLLTVSDFRLQQFLSIALGTILIIYGIHQNNAVIIYGFSAFGLNLFVRFFCPNQLRQHGIIVSGNLIRWSRIQSYEWSERSSQCLLLNLRSKNWHRKWKIRVSANKRSQVAEILSRKLEF